MAINSFMRPGLIRRTPVVEKEERSSDKDLMEVYAAMAQLIPNNMKLKFNLKVVSDSDTSFKIKETRPNKYRIVCRFNPKSSLKNIPQAFFEAVHKFAKENIEAKNKSQLLEVFKAIVKIIPEQSGLSEVYKAVNKIIPKEED